ncbi:restriction endonuclease subunit S [Lacrimispora sp. NSJ-141]|uniref:Restriction endonuclease subunit S n=1 Tax=Lientehia hominis TaxID=2897778 RepID=A0AAP2RK65_9FIRM|nr:restriction endonuclease subunit S [Lientehia hominis]MCD2492964.1 restriction endonuclease subunit S [Lientehia hominis]
MKKYRLEEVAEIYSGATPLTKEKKYYENGTISWITPKDLSGYNHKYICEGQRNITEEGFQSCATYKLPEGTVLFSSRAPIGYVALAGKELCTNQGFKSFVCKEELLYNHYLYYYLLFNRKKIEALGNGSTFKEISRKTIGKYEIELPNVDEQKRIVDELVSLDDKYEHNCEMMDNLQTLLETLYIHYFENENCVYEYKTLSSIVELVTGGTPSTKNENYWNNGAYDWYTPSDVTSCNRIFSFSAGKKISILGLANSGAKLIPKESVIMSSRATIGECIININEATTNQGMLALIPDKENICALQLFFWIKRHKALIESISNGSTFKEVYKKDMDKLKVVINKEKMREFMEETKLIIEYYESLMEENHLIEQLKEKIMQMLFA